MSERPRIAIVCRDLELAWFRLRRSVDELLSHGISVALVAPEGSGLERWRDAGYDVRTYARPPRGGALLEVPVLAPQLIEFAPQVVLITEDADLNGAVVASQVASVGAVVALVDRLPLTLRRLESLPDSAVLARRLPSRQSGRWASALERFPQLQRVDHALRLALGTAIARYGAVQGMQIVKSWLVTARSAMPEFESTNAYAAGRVQAHDQGFGVELEVFGDLADNPVSRNHARRELNLDGAQVVVAATLHGSRSAASTWRLLSLLSALSDQVPSMHLVFAGDSVADKEAVELVDRLVAEGRATVAPLLGERADVLAAADLFVDDGPVAHFTLEAAAAGLPCVVAGDATWREVVREGETGLRLDFDDREEAVRSIRGLCDDAERRFTMSRAARHRALRVFDDALMRRRLMRVLDAVFAELAGAAYQQPHPDDEPARELRSVADLLERS